MAACRPQIRDSAHGKYSNDTRHTDFASARMNLHFDELGAKRERNPIFGRARDHAATMNYDPASR
jgi:hypothetical protein